MSLAYCAFIFNHEGINHICDAVFGANIHEEHCSFIGTHRFMFHAFEKNTFLTFRRCMIDGWFQDDSARGSNCKSAAADISIHLESSACANMLACELKHMDMGLVGNTFQAFLRRCAMSSVVSVCAVAHSGKLSAIDCVFQGAGDAVSGHVVLGNADSVVSLTDSQFLNNFVCGICVRVAAQLTAKSCEMAGNSQRGIVAKDAEVRISVSDTVCSGGEVGVFVHGCHACSLQRVKTNNSYTGFGIDTVQNCSIVECSAETYTEAGITFFFLVLVVQCV